MRTASVLAAVVLVGAAALVATPASAAPPLTCGETVTVSRALTTDLACPGPEPALTLAAGVTLNLKGHRVTGPGTGVGILLPQDGDVVIRNGTLAGWGRGIATGGPGEEPRSGTVTVERLRFTASTVGIDASGVLPFSGGKFTIVNRSRFEHVSTGIDAGWFADVEVTDSTFVDSGTGIEVDTSVAEVWGSRFTRTSTAIDVVEGEARVHDSTFTDNEAGVRVYFMGGATIDGSTLRGNGVAVSVYGYVHVDLTGNTFSMNTAALDFGTVNGTITGNTFRRNGSGLHGTDFSPDGLVVQDNVLTRNGDAIVFDAADANTSLGGNTATRNSGWGINAPGVTDLGGYTASRNGTSPQCVGVNCGSPHS